MLRRICLVIEILQKINLVEYKSIYLYQRLSSFVYVKQVDSLRITLHLKFIHKNDAFKRFLFSHRTLGSYNDLLTYTK